MAKVRILSIDGGGIRGIIPGVILAALEAELAKQSGNPDAKLVDYFDFVAGTSTGGILTCLYLTPDDVSKAIGSRRPKFSAKDAVNLYLENGDEIFGIPVFHRIRTGGGLLDEKYPAQELERVLRNYVGDTELKDLLKPCLVTSYDIRNRQAFFFCQHEAAKSDKYNFYVRDVARCTSAAPTFFECARIKAPRDQTEWVLIDGGVFANNPALCAYAEVRKLTPTPPLPTGNELTAKDMILVSVGTGHSQLQSYNYAQAKDWGLAEWAIPILDIFSSGQAETIDYPIKSMFATIPPPLTADYYRHNVELKNVDPHMDNASPKNMQALKRLGEDYAASHATELSQLATLLINNGLSVA